MQVNLKNNYSLGTGNQFIFVYINTYTFCMGEKLGL
jgi:hypothetical protein